MTNDPLIPDHRRPTLTQQLPSELINGQAPFTVEYSYYNCTGNTVILSLKNGLRLELKSDASLTNSGFTVKVMYKFAKHTAERLCTLLANQDCPKDDPLYPFKEGLLTRPNKQGNKFIVVVDYRVEKKEFGGRGGSIYIADLDVVLSLSDSLSGVPLHPGSEDYLRSIHGQETLTNSFVYKLSLVDNSQSVSTKFINIDGAVYAINPQTDPARLDGLYRYSRRPYEPHSKDLVSYETYFTLSDLVKAGLYDTVDDAAHKGDATLRKKEELLHAEHNADRARLENDLAKHEAARAAAVAQASAAEAKHALDMELMAAKHNEAIATLETDKARLSMKDHYDEKGYKRKDDSEFMKHLPVIILGVGSAIAVLMNFL